MSKKDKPKYTLSFDPDKGVQAIGVGGKKSTWYPNELRILKAIWSDSIVWESTATTTKPSGGKAKNESNRPTKR